MKEIYIVVEVSIAGQRNEAVFDSLDKANEYVQSNEHKLSSLTIFDIETWGLNSSNQLNKT